MARRLQLAPHFLHQSVGWGIVFLQLGTHEGEEIVAPKIRLGCLGKELFVIIHPAVAA